MNANNYIFNLGQKFSYIAYKNRNRIAIKEANGQSVTYKELNWRSNKIANYLLKMGVKKGDVVVILNNKSIDAFASMLACLKLGAIYSNLDPNSPIERFKRMLITCNPKCLLFAAKDNGAIVDKLADNSLQTIDYSSQQFEMDLAQEKDVLPEANSLVTAQNPAYIMFTSGSTGFPKGVVIPHGSIMNFIEWTQTTFLTMPSDAFTNLNPMHFDNSVFDFYASLFSGATLLPVGDTVTKNPRKLLDVLNQLRPTIWFSVPSMLVFVLNMRALKTNDLSNLRVVAFGGEGFPKNKLRELWQMWSGRLRFVNVYGPTECTCICSSYDVAEIDMQNDDLLPLGPIAPNFSATVVNENNELVPVGDIGELCIGGPNVGLGYYNNHTKTQESFISNPSVLGYSEKMYKTGDLVCFDADRKVFFFKGRKDNQIKRMGYRIELEEIENALNSLTFVQESAVIYVDNPKYPSKIIACLKGNRMDLNLISKELSANLPSYMMPDKIDFYEDLPKNQNGKLDRIGLKSNYM